MKENKDKLESFITEHRAAFDMMEPDPRIWNRIDSDLRPKGGNTMVYWLLGVIAVLVISISLMFGMQIGQSKQSQPAYFASESQFDEFKETQDYYTTMVNYNLSQIKDPQQSEQVRNDLDQLDEIYLELKAELENSPNGDSEMIIGLMIQNYKNKIDILEKVLTKSKDKNNDNNQNIFNDETINL
jgi:hypothetical protein